MPHPNSILITGKRLVLFILYFTIVMETLIAEFHFSTSIRYINDIAILMLILLMKGKFIYVLKKSRNSIILSTLVIFLLAVSISALINFVPLRLVIWATRNTFRGIIFLLAAICYLEEDDLKIIFNILFKIQAVNLFLALYQFLILRHEMDWVGGIFGYGNGAGINMFNALLIAYFLNAYLEKKEKLSKLIFIIFSSFTIAGIAEEKVTYLFFIVIFITSLLFANISFKKIVAIGIGTLGYFGGLVLLKYNYPIMFERMTNIQKLIDYASTTYETGYMLPRIGAFSVISDIFFNSETLKSLFGLGFGNAETSGFSIFQSDFFNQYGYLNYRWFTHQWMFIEVGYAGFVTFVMFLLAILFCLIKNINTFDKNNRVYILTGIPLTLCCIITIWYNSTLKVDMSFLAYFCLAVGLIATKKSSIYNKK